MKATRCDYCARIEPDSGMFRGWIRVEPLTRLHSLDPDRRGMITGIMEFCSPEHMIAYFSERDELTALRGGAGAQSMGGEPIPVADGPDAVPGYKAFLANIVDRAVQGDGGQS